jgi:hypothetical protein
MGRKRTKGPSASVSSSQQQSSQHDEIIDSLKMTFLNLIGSSTIISGSNNDLSMVPTSPSHDESRDRLVETLRAFASETQIYDINSNYNQNHNHNNEFNLDENNLERLESIARQLRTDVSMFSEYLNVEREEVFHVYRELQDTIHQTCSPSLSSSIFNAREELIVLESI